MASRTELKQKKKASRKNYGPWLTLALVFLIVGVVFARGFFGGGEEKRKEPEPPKKTAEKTPPPPPPEKPKCPLDGAEGTEESVARRPLAVMIENHTTARPQSGLDKACLVYEVVAEGGITRFLALYVHNDAEALGPVRSTREYYVSLAKSVNAMLSHAGGSPDGYDKIRLLGVDSLDQFANGGSYWRTRDRRAPHNLYSSTKNLRLLQDKKGLSSTGLPPNKDFKKDAKPEERPASAEINLDFSGRYYQVKYQYDPDKNDYVRYVAGLPHRDARSGANIRPKNIVVLLTDIGSSGAGKGRMSVRLTGRGNAVFFQDGKWFSGTWERGSEESSIAYQLTDGSDFQFNPGQTWVEILPSAQALTHQESTKAFSQ